MRRRTAEVEQVMVILTFYSSTNFLRFIMSVFILVFLQFFGITCGLSAPYVAGQIDYAMHQLNYTTVLVGFNPVTLARDTPIEKWHKTCRDVSGCMHMEGIACI